MKNLLQTLLALVGMYGLLYMLLATITLIDFITL